jgi:hypothetical protein
MARSIKMKKSQIHADFCNVFFWLQWAEILKPSANLDCATAAAALQLPPAFVLARCRLDEPCTSQFANRTDALNRKL